MRTAVRSNPNFYLYLGLALAVLVGYWTYIYVQAATRSEMVLVAVKDLEPYVPVPTDALRLEPRPKAAIPKDALRDPADAAGHRPQSRVVAGDMVRASHLSEQAGNPLSQALYREFDRNLGYGALALDIVPGMIVGGKVRAGDVVDILTYGKAPAVGASPEATGRTVLERIRLLDVVRPEQAGTGGKMIAVLAVTRTQAETLIPLIADGKVAVRLLPTGVMPDGLVAQSASQSAGTEGVDQNAQVGR